MVLSVAEEVECGVKEAGRGGLGQKGTQETSRAEKGGRRRALGLDLAVKTAATEKEGAVTVRTRLLSISRSRRTEK